ncbi:hypothetical protein AAG570_011509 [Ranatra chinensis]|uniref:Uncharacterized protein n=1 Tax=Ranatra chinensis TaxID=642074 RepID=A0ABD0YKU2_9HEMI
MLTLYYVAATWIQSWKLSSTLAKLKSVIQKDGSLVVHQKLPPYIFLSGTVPQQIFEVDSVLSKQCSNHSIAKIRDLLWFSENKKMVSIFPKQHLDISGWVSVIPGRTHLPVQIKNKKKAIASSDKLFVLLEADYNTCQFRSSYRSIEIENYGVPVAWHTAVVMSILLETDEMNLASLCVAFQNNVTLENGIQIIRIECKYFQLWFCIIFCVCEIQFLKSAL